MKNTYYFPHDYHARHDPKLERLRMLYGCVTDGVYWCLVEMMYEQGGYLAMDDMPVFAKLLNTDIDTINKVIGSDLFKQDDGKCYSDAVLDRLNHINKVREDRKHAGKLGGDAKAVANAKQMLSNIKESKGKESKENIPPSIETVSEYCKERKNGIQAKDFVDYYKARGWMLGKVKMKDWRAAIHTWENRRNVVKKPTMNTL